ncbi:hypothetical protein D3C81_1449500 [compost metagenome]
MRQAIAQVLAGDRHHQAQVGHHQLAGGIDGIVIAQVARQALLFLRGQQRNPVDCLDIAVQVAHGRGEGQRKAAPATGRRRQTAGRQGLVGRQDCVHSIAPFASGGWVAGRAPRLLTGAAAALQHILALQPGEC